MDCGDPPAREPVRGRWAGSGEEGGEGADHRGGEGEDRGEGGGGGGLYVPVHRDPATGIVLAEARVTLPRRR
ncbi:hypothetical protein E5082_30600 [Streptomyces griseoluteus]|uniref:Uncharacterized protein n=1 Tax=Streptomyces griseoluteus TaxID=29306 RepID=A0A4Z1CYY6_STRGP|nr:hypothetical protein E5082_30600 [Streptomyces griseoluteus]GHF33286.1 hypothetical protein GCM10017776_59740 [Streptomyces griseoluteus]